MSDEKKLTIIEQKPVTLYEDELIAVRADDGQVYVSIRHISESLGLARQGQMRRIRDHRILSKGLASGNISLPNGKRKASWLRIDLIPLWLSGIRVSSVKEEIQPKLEHFQTEAARILWEAFQAGELTSPDNDIESLAKLDPQAAEALVMAQAIVKLARAQLRQAAIVQDNTQRIEALETALNDTDRRVSDEQASQISQAVKAIAMELSTASGKNEFGGVYGELYRRQGVTSYKMIKTADYDKCMTWLNEWYQSLANKDLQF